MDVLDAIELDDHPELAALAEHLAASGRACRIMRHGKTVARLVPSAIPGEAETTEPVDIRGPDWKPDPHHVGIDEASKARRRAVGCAGVARGRRSRRSAGPPSINILNGRPRALRLINRFRPEGLAVSVISYGEIYEGVYTSNDRAQAEHKLAEFAAEVAILPVTLSVARRFAAIRGDLRRAGTLIADMDLLIAATAIEHELALVTGNRRHFDRTPGLAIHPDA